MMAEEMIKWMDGGMVEGEEISGTTGEGEGGEEAISSSSSNRQMTTTVTAVLTTTGEVAAMVGVVRTAAVAVSEGNGRSCFNKATVEHRAS